VGQKRGSRFILYGGMGYTEPKYRDKGATPFTLGSTNAWLVENNCLFTFMVRSFPIFKTFVYQIDLNILCNFSGDISRISSNHEKISTRRVRLCSRYSI
jgi:hypothetical protein